MGPELTKFSSWSCMASFSTMRALEGEPECSKLIRGLAMTLSIKFFSLIADCYDLRTIGTMFCAQFPVADRYTNVWYLWSSDSCPEGSIDLKCKERVTDSDDDEPDGKVAAVNYYPQLYMLATDIKEFLLNSNNNTMKQSTFTEIHYFIAIFRYLYLT